MRTRLQGVRHADRDAQLPARAIGAQVYIPSQMPEQVVRPHHVRSARVTLDNFGVLADREFEGRLQTAG